MAKRVPFVTTSQLANMAKVSRSVIYRAIQNEELKTINAPVKGAKKFFAKFTMKDATEWIDARGGKREPKLPLFDETRPLGRMSSLEQKLDLILAKLNRLEKLWS